LLLVLVLLLLLLAIAQCSTEPVAAQSSLLLTHQWM
jgi:hypothetical protein